MQPVSTLPPQVINYDTDLPAHYTLSATFNFHDVSLNDQEQAALKVIWNEWVFLCPPLCCVSSPSSLSFFVHHVRCCRIRSRWRSGVV